LPHPLPHTESVLQKLARVSSWKDKPRKLEWLPSVMEEITLPWSRRAHVICLSSVLITSQTLLCYIPWVDQAPSSLPLLHLLFPLPGLLFTSLICCVAHHQASIQEPTPLCHHHFSLYTYPISIGVRIFDCLTSCHTLLAYGRLSPLSRVEASWKQGSVLRALRPCLCPKQSLSKHLCECILVHIQDLHLSNFIKVRKGLLQEK
jgi:hypothetical protein